MNCSTNSTSPHMGKVEWHGFCDLTVEDLTPGKKATADTAYEREPLVQVFNRMITDRPEGAFWSYAETARLSQQLLGSPQYGSSLELRRKLSGKLSRELIEKDGIQVTVGQKQGGERGIRVDKYQHPQGYQRQLDM